MKQEVNTGLLDELPRAAGVPLAHLTGWQRFMGLDFHTSLDALIPRKETELLAAAALEILRDTVRERGPARVLDLCTGSGNLALTLAHFEPACEVCATDISNEAIALARRNAQQHRLTERVRFFRGDLFGALPADTDAFDLIICNPPYISSGKLDRSELIVHEPRMAFDGGPFGLNIITRLVQESPARLKPGSWLCFEIGRGQGEFVGRLLERSGKYVEISKFFDAADDVRALAARVPESTG